MRALLFTGGLDSVMLWRRLGPDVLCVYVDTPGNPYAAAERSTILRLADMAPGMSVAMIEGPRLPPPAADGHVLHRNLSLLTTVAAATGADRLYLGVVLGEASPDKSARFLRAAGRALSASENRRVRVCAPLRRRTKAHLVAQHLRRWPEDRGLLLASRSCYAPEGRCGRCQACARRWVAFTLAGIHEDTDAWPGGVLRDRLADGSWWQALRRAPASQWPGMAVNNARAWQALWRDAVLP